MRESDSTLSPSLRPNTDEDQDVLAHSVEVKSESECNSGIVEGLPRE